MEAKVEVERLSSGSGNKALGAEPQCFLRFHKTFFHFASSAVFGSSLRLLARV